MPEPYDPNPLAPPPGSPYNPYGGAPTAPPPRPPLGNGRQPADLGMSGLGLVMQLAGTVFAGLMGVMGVMLLITMMRFSGRGGGQGADILMLLLMATTGVMRSIAHRNAGARLLYHNEMQQGTALSGIRRYLVMSVIQIVVWCGYFAYKGVPGEFTTSLLIIFGGWPLTLAILFSMPQFKQLDQGIPVPEDKGFEGASILMSLLGLIGLFFGLAMLYSVLQAPSEVLSHLMYIPPLVFILLVIRSSLHTMAGWRGVTETHVDRAVEGATRYANFGVITAFVAGGGMLLMFMMAGVMQIELIMMVTLVVLLLLGWPLTIRRFFVERQFADMLGGGPGGTHRRAPDMGHTTLGWLLLGFGVYTLSVTLPSAAILPDAMREGMGGRGGDPFSMLFQLGGATTRSPWWIVGGAALQIWAGLELIRMTDTHKLVASIYGVVATAVAIYVNLPMFESIKEQGLGAFFGGGGGLGGQGPILLSSVAITLVMPIGTLILVNRRASGAVPARPAYPPPPGQ
jgi:hypothetical protein